MDLTRNALSLEQGRATDGRGKENWRQWPRIRI